MSSAWTLNDSPLTVTTITRQNTTTYTVTSDRDPDPTIEDVPDEPGEEEPEPDNTPVEDTP
jgi:hypothetical protein